MGWLSAAVGTMVMVPDYWYVQGTFPVMFLRGEGYDSFWQRKSEVMLIRRGRCLPADSSWHRACLLWASISAVQFMCHTLFQAGSNLRNLVRTIYWTWWRDDMFLVAWQDGDRHEDFTRFPRDLRQYMLVYV